MQPLSRVKPDAQSMWGSSNTMSFRPKIAIKVAECIAEWTEIETGMAMFLGFLLHTKADTAISMLISLENRAAQLRMIDAAAKAELKPDHYDIISMLTVVHIKPAMRDRDKLAHWCWGYSPELDDALLLRSPDDKILHSYRANELGIAAGTTASIRTNYSKVFVVREDDLTRMLGRFTDAKKWVMHAASSVWNKLDDPDRAGFLRTLANEPGVQAALIRLRESRQKNQATQQPSPQPEPSGKS